jgi:hypothetical protein
MHLKLQMVSELGGIIMALKDKFQSMMHSVKEKIGMEDESVIGEDQDTKMSSSELKKTFLDVLSNSQEERFDNKLTRPEIELWPYDDEFGQWVASHQNKARVIICNTPEFRDTPYCGSGLH